MLSFRSKLAGKRETVPYESFVGVRQCAHPTADCNETDDRALAPVSDPLGPTFSDAVGDGAVLCLRHAAAAQLHGASVGRGIVGQNLDGGGMGEPRRHFQSAQATRRLKGIHSGALLAS